MNLASMGPRLCSRGNSLGTAITIDFGISFNGATTLQPWKSAPKTKIRRPNIGELQWGHDFAAVEIWR